MKKAILLAILLLSVIPAAAQPTRKKQSPTTSPAARTPTPRPTPVSEKESFETAMALTSAEAKAVALKQFLADFPQAEHRLRALESLVVARAAWADERLAAGDVTAGTALFETALKEAPEPISDRLFSEVIVKFPANLYWRGERRSAYAMAATLETKAAGRSRRLAELAAFYLSVEDGREALRLAEAAVAADARNVDAHLALAMAKRLNFDISGAAASFRQALELNGTSRSAKLGLADMLRAGGEPEKAAALYAELTAADAKDAAAETGLALAKLAIGGEEGDEAILAVIDKRPDDLSLLVGAGYAYAARGDAEKAIEYGRMATQVEPRYIWGHIVLARGLALSGDLLKAETTLLQAKRTADFPTIDFEIATIRLEAGLYREAVEELKKSFTIKDGRVHTRLGRRVENAAASFAELLAGERRAAILQPKPAASSETDEKLTALLRLDKELSAENPNAAAAAEAAERFIAGADKMRVFRELYAADRLSRKGVALEKAMELTRSAVSHVDAGLEAAAAGPAAMADELYESRVLAFSRNDFIVIPEVPKPTLSAIIRGRIEETAGWTLYQEGKHAEALVRMRRAMSVMPEKSAWWRATAWKYGTILQAAGQEKEALDQYVKSYVIDKPDLGHFLVIESLYQKINGSRDGLEKLVGPSPVLTVAKRTDAVGDEPTPIKPEPTPETTPTPEPTTEATPTPEPTPETTPTPEPTPEATPTPEPTPEATPMPEPKPEATPTPEATPMPEPTLEATPTPEPTTEATPTPEPTPETTPTPEPTPASSSSPLAASKTEPEKRQLFEPIIITIPRVPAKKPAEPAGEITADGRPRVIKDRTEPGECTLSVSQESVSILNDGGSIGILVGIESGVGSIESLTAVSDSPADIEAALQPDLGIKNKRFFVIRSISKRTGMFTVKFSGACVERSVTVRVR